MRAWGGIAVVSVVSLAACRALDAPGAPPAETSAPRAAISSPSTAAPIPSASGDLPIDSAPCLLWMPPKLRHRAPYARVFELERPTIKIGPVGPEHGIGDMDTAVKLEDGERVVAAIMICNAPLFLVHTGAGVRLDLTTESGASVRPHALYPTRGEPPLDPGDATLRIVGICRTHTHAAYALDAGRDHLLVTWSDGAFRARRMAPLPPGEHLVCDEADWQREIGGKVPAAQ
ncbi:MAG: hypothetical protein U0414_11495 [Polyangiaceae bacterium]